MRHGAAQVLQQKPVQDQQSKEHKVFQAQHGELPSRPSFFSTTASNKNAAFGMVRC